MNGKINRIEKETQRQFDKMNTFMEQMAQKVANVESMIEEEQSNNKLVVKKKVIIQPLSIQSCDSGENVSFGRKKEREQSNESNQKQAERPEDSSEQQKVAGNECQQRDSEVDQMFSNDVERQQVNPERLESLRKYRKVDAEQQNVEQGEFSPANCHVNIVKESNIHQRLLEQRLSEHNESDKKSNRQFGAAPSNRDDNASETSQGVTEGRFEDVEDFDKLDQPEMENHQDMNNAEAKKEQQFAKLNYSQALPDVPAWNANNLDESTQAQSIQSQMRQEQPVKASYGRGHKGRGRGGSAMMVPIQKQAVEPEHNDPNMSQSFSLRDFQSANKQNDHRALHEEPLVPAKVSYGRGQRAVAVRPQPPKEEQKKNNSSDDDDIPAWLNNNSDGEPEPINQFQQREEVRQPDIQYQEELLPQRHPEAPSQIINMNPGLRHYLQQNIQAFEPSINPQFIQTAVSNRDINSKRQIGGAMQMAIISYQSLQPRYFENTYSYYDIYSSMKIDQAQFQNISEAIADELGSQDSIGALNFYQGSMYGILLMDRKAQSALQQLAYQFQNIAKMEIKRLDETAVADRVQKSWGRGEKYILF